MQFRLISCVVTITIMGASAFAADSPQFRGLNRDGKFPETGLMQSWPAGGPPIAWVYKGLGNGYSSVSVASGTVYVTTALDDMDGYIFALDLDGNLKWKAPYGKETDDGQASGPRSALTVDGDKGYLMSGLGEVVCLNLADKGSVVWRVNTLDKFKGEQITWSLAESVLVDGDKVICTPGGPDASMVALDKDTGDTIWTSKGLSEASAYCSPDIFIHNGHRILVTMTQKSVVGLNPDTGQVYWVHPHETNYDIHATKPVYADGMLYYSAGYGSGGGMLRLSEDGKRITQGWKEETLDNQHHGLVLHEGYIYGTSQSSSELICLELATGKVMWHTDVVTQGVTVFADGMLYVYEGPKAGVVSLVKATPTGFERTGSFEVTQGDGQHWTHPTIAEKRLFIRHGDALVVYDLAAK